MNIVKKQIDDLNIELTLSIAKDDYAEIEKKKLADCRRKAEFKGFRKGMVPASLIQRVYGEQVLADSVNEVISKSLEDYVTSNDLHLLGEPLGSDKQPEIEWKDGNDFTFVFDAALTPEVNVEVVKEDTVPQYSITLTAKDKESMIESMKKYYEGKEGEEKKSDEDIEKDVTERLRAQYKQESDWRLDKDVRNYFIEKSGIKLPEDFLRRWLLYANAGKVSKEDIEKEFGGFVEDFKWQLVRGFFMRKYDFKIEEKDITEAAEGFVRYQYAMYGLSDVPADMLAEAVKNILNDRKQLDRLAEQVEDVKVLTKLKEEITLKAKKISAEKFRELQ